MTEDLALRLTARRATRRPLLKLTRARLVGNNAATAKITGKALDDLIQGSSMNDIANEDEIESMMQSLEGMVREIRETNDIKAQQEIILRMTAIQKKLDSLQASQLAAFSALLNLDGTTNDNERVARLLQAFELGAKLSHIYFDVMPDEDACNKVMRQTYDIAHTLDALGVGLRPALAAFLDHPDLDVRAMAAASLPDIMPDRAIPVLKKIQRKARGTSAGNVAFTTLTMWEGRKKD